MNELLRELHDDSLSKKTALGLQKEEFEALRQNLSHCTGIASSVLTYTNCEIIALRKIPSNELQACVDKIKKMPLIPCDNSDVKTALQLELYRKNLLEVFSLFNSVCPERSNWKLSTSHPYRNISFSVVVEAKDLKERLYRCNDIQVEAELSLAPAQSVLSAPLTTINLQRAASSGQRLQFQNTDPSVLGFQGVKAIQSTTQIGQVSSNGKGTYTITFTPSTAGCYNLSVTINGQHIKDSPKCVTIDSFL